MEKGGASEKKGSPEKGEDTKAAETTADTSASKVIFFIKTSSL